MRENIPTGLRQNLEVYRLVRWSGCDRKTAEKKIAQIHRVTSRTIASAITRNIGINTEDLDHYIKLKNSEAFRNHLVRHFPSFQDDIEAFFESIGVSDKGKSSSRALRPLFPDEKKNVFMSLILEEAKDNLSRWLERDDLPKDLRQEIKRLNDFVAKG